MDFRSFFNEYVFGFMCNDIQNCMKAKANFLVALGLCAYTEHMGGLATGHLKDEGWSRRNYEAFLPYMGPYYVNLHKQVDLYKRVRCGLVHEYFIKGAARTIAMRKGTPNDRGIIFDSKADHVWFVVEAYYEDWKEAVGAYLQDLQTRPELQEKFTQAVT